MRLAMMSQHRKPQNQELGKTPAITTTEAP